MTRYVCSKCDFASESRGAVAKHIKQVHYRQRGGGDTDPVSYEYRPKIMEYEPKYRSLWSLLSGFFDDE